MTHLSTTSEQWPAMWDALRDATGDYADCCPETGECWQYMGTYGGNHEFRHRHRPKSARAITGQSEAYYDRVNLRIDAKTLEVANVGCQKYMPQVKIWPKPPSALADSRAIGERTEAGREQNRLDAIRRARESDNHTYGGAFDGFSVSSDADPGL